ncbi:PEGA domain-containing protein [Myxococcota bacterium]|nr:PEGA domain-containing protein [Myxococcota bacterium]MBU1431558.1 PEGA domain-containing protein [Myxococcota bacterium]MBU1898756.1 PEGA domain-containing protein [Myxococcota bacterium]
MRVRRASTATTAATLAALQILFGLPLTAFAQMPPPKVWLSPIKAKDGAGGGLLSEKFDESTRKQLLSGKRVISTDAARSAAISAGEADPRIEQAENLRVAAKEALKAGQAKDAHEKLLLALKLYEEGLASISKLEALFETMGYLGAVSADLGFDVDAKRLFKAVIAVVPQGEPMDEYTAKAKSIYAKEKKKLLKKKPGGLKVITTPPGATIKVDGVERGVSPLTLEGLVRGDHYIQAAHAEAGLAAKKVQVKSKKVKEVSLELKAVLGPKPAEKVSDAEAASLTALAHQGDIDFAFREKAEAIAKKTQADYVVVGFLRPEGESFTLVAFMYGVAQKQVIPFEDFTFGARLASVFVQAARFARAIEAAALEFPTERAVVGKVDVSGAAPPPAKVDEPASTSTPIAALPPMPDDKPMGDDLLGTTPPPKRNDDDREPWYGAWWVWTIAGAAVIGGTATAGYLLLDEDATQDHYDATVRWGN